MQKKKAISLIVLVITIIVMIILASAIILSLDNANIFTKAEEAVLRSDAKNFQEELSISLAEKKLEDRSFETTEVNVAKLAAIKEYIPSFPDKYYGIFCIKNGELAYVAGNVTDEEKTVLEQSGLVKGSYITEPQAKAIYDEVDELNLGEDVSTTNIAEYVEGIHEEQASKFVIYQGNIYYRYDKTTYDERLSLYTAGISCFMGDSNADGTLTDEDVLLIEGYAGFEYEEFPENMYYVSDLSYDGWLDTNDSSCVEIAIYKQMKYVDLIEQTNQDPEYLAIYGLNSKISEYVSVSNENTITDYKQIMNKFPLITKEEAKKIIVYEGHFYFRYDKLSEKEKTWCEAYNWPVMQDTN